jgi:alcohol dehydrogenase, propanol-preferring
VRAMVLDAPRTPLRREGDRPVPEPAPGEVVVRVRACGVCRTDLHLVDGELPHPKLPVVPGHEVVGIVSAVGPGVTRFALGQRVGFPWLASTDGTCPYCRSGRENLCDHAEFTGYTRDGGYAEYLAGDARYGFPLPDGIDDRSAAPLLCAGMIGFRALRLAGPALRIGFYGFGASAHIAIQIARDRGQEVYAFARPGDRAAPEFARRLGAVWAGGSDERPPVPLDAAILFAPVGALLPAALAATAKGGTVVCAGIHMSDVPSFPYDLLWEERVVRSVANLTRQDGDEFLQAAQAARVRTTTTPFPLEAANEAIDAVRHGRIEGAAVLVP